MELHNADTPRPSPSTARRRRVLRVVITGHRHGKSTVIGRLLADTGYRRGQTRSARCHCERNAKPFDAFCRRPESFLRGSRSTRAVLQDRAPPRIVLDALTYRVLKNIDRRRGHGAGHRCEGVREFAAPRLSLSMLASVDRGARQQDGSRRLRADSIRPRRPAEYMQFLDRSIRRSIIPVAAHPGQHCHPERQPAWYRGPTVPARSRGRSAAA